jgi:mono/diheme cytochrome c family protein
MRRTLTPLAVVAAMLVFCGAAHAQEGDAERGKKALLTRSFTPAIWKLDAYESAWKSWDPAPAAKPANYSQAFMDHYGLHPAPYDNDGLPMGLRHGQMPLVGKGISSDCLLCHGGSIGGKSYIGLGNASLDVQAVFEELSKASNFNKALPFTFSNARGTSEAATMAIFLLSFREPDLAVRGKALDFGGLHDDLCEDVPAWWHLKKKKTMYHTGSTHARSVRSLMQFALSPLNSPEWFDREEATFRDIQAYILTLSPPKYPLPIDDKLAARGKLIFNETCSRCHGTYGDNWTYPNKVIPLKEIGTDPRRFEGLAKAWGEYYNKSWFGKEKVPGAKMPLVKDTDGYQAPPLDGIWATAPYFHNGSVPTVYSVLNSKARPKIFTRSFKTGMDEYDAANLGWKVQVLQRGPDAGMPAFERRKVYDTTQPGRGNGGHTFGDDLTDDERRAVIEYLKTL